MSHGISQNFLLAAVLSTLASAHCFGQESLLTPAPSQAVRNNVWSFGISGLRYTLKAGDGNEVLGNAGGISIGNGYIDKSWYLNAHVDIILGPYEPARAQQLNVDFLGTGFTTWWGYSAQNVDLRSTEGGYGFALGLSYTDIVGRSIGKNRKVTNDEIRNKEMRLLDNYTLRVTNLAILPAIFFSWLKPGRPYGNTPELLATRSEGYLLTVGVAMPLVASYKAKYIRPKSPEEIQKLQEEKERRAQEGDDSEEPFVVSEVDTVIDKAKMRGYTLILGLTAFLGT